MKIANLIQLFNFLEVLSLILVVLKLCGLVQISWIAALSPIIPVIAFWGAIGGYMLGVIYKTKTK